MNGPTYTPIRTIRAGDVTGPLGVAPAPDVAIAGPITGFKVKKERKHSHYFKPCPFDAVDVYRVLVLFAVADPCLQHAIKKLLVAGGRGGGKDISRDIQEAIDTLERWKEMRDEELEATKH
jgi:hypothetical protein